MTLNHNEIQHLACASDHEKVDAPPYTPAPRAPAVQGRLDKYTHNMSWRDREEVAHSLTLRTDDPRELWGMVLGVKRVIRASREKGSTAPPAPVEGGRTCKVHDAAMSEAISRKTGKKYHSHQLIDGSRCFGRKKA